MYAVVLFVIKMIHLDYLMLISIFDLFMLKFVHILTTVDHDVQ